MTEHPAPLLLPGTKIAITGGVAEGKSTVLRILVEHGIECLSADDAAKEVLEEASIQENISKAIGVSLPLDRKVLLGEILQDVRKRRLVNQILHPEVLSRLLQSSASFIEIPLLFEGCLHGLFERIWVVTCGHEEQLRRLTDRLGDEPLANRLIKSQLSSEIKVAFADQVIRTNCPLANVQRQVVFLAQSYGLVA